jgi:chemotaxis family two-component system response regulator PixG
MYRIAWQHDLVNSDEAALRIGWDYALLYLWVAQQKITREQVAKIIGSIVVEVLFDVAQAVKVTHQAIPQSLLYPPLVSLQVGDIILETQSLWQSWQAEHLIDYLPNKAPVIQQPDRLRTRISAEVYHNLVQLLKGEHTLRDLAVHMQRDIVTVTISLRPFLQKQWIELIKVADLSAPIYRQGDRFKAPSTSSNAPPPGALVACVDDSSSVQYMLKRLLTSAGYEFLGIEDPLGAVGILLARKPDFIFLDLVMPKVNGHELCEQLRKLSVFRTTPIVILTGNNGFANRLKSNVFGASDFLSKPLDADAVLGVLHKHLAHKSISLTTTS